MIRYSHQIAIAFDVISDREDGEDITIEQIRRALYKRVADLVHDGAWKEAFLPPLDTAEVEAAPQLSWHWVES